MWRQFLLVGRLFGIQREDSRLLNASRSDETVPCELSQLDSRIGCCDSQRSDSGKLQPKDDFTAHLERLLCFGCRCSFCFRFRSARGYVATTPNGTDIKGFRVHCEPATRTREKLLHMLLSRFPRLPLLDRIESISSCVPFSDSFLTIWFQ